MCIRALGVPIIRKGKGRTASNKLVRSRTEHQMRARVRGDSLNRSDSFRAFSPPVTTLGSPSNSKAEIPYVAASMVKVVKYGGLPWVFYYLHHRRCHVRDFSLAVAGAAESGYRRRESSETVRSVERIPAYPGSHLVFSTAAH